MQRANSLAMNVPMPLADVLAMPLSFECLYYTSPAWSDRKKQIEHGDVVSKNLFERLSNLQLSLNALMRAR